ncbi:hypothetical protein B4092_5009 [Bacillus licheniformis]|nr:hypothetical protein B4092_5009 [Bacillus licheniformis]TWJ63295.1 hypothetical protein CHCC5020_0759 [Bacillus licheniformis]TWL30342.1 hypothetical protein CHCC16874_1107 [Bacillus licheniformis]TWN48754.1 hypothetical protein CHCC14437_0707 [Bacillus licheniformis]TWN51317.1 hypothetical protein CHCC14441_1415 [Bacillus licheniformis]
MPDRSVQDFLPLEEGFFYSAARACNMGTSLNYYASNQTFFS